MVLLIDNYDSFTWNLAHRLGELGAQVTVKRNDAVSVADIERMAPEKLVISPGPGRPESAGVSIDALRHFAGRLPMHGKTSAVAHEGSHLFAGLASPFEAGRYHSLVVARDVLPEEFTVSAWTTEDETVMGIRHQRWPIFGVQFHPESVLTPVGQRLLENFLRTR